MSLKIVESEEALTDVINIADYIAEKSSLNVSDRFLEATKQAFRQLASMPGMGVLRNYGKPAFIDMRMWPIPGFRSYLIFYRATEEELYIVRVLHGAQNVQDIFSPNKGD